MTIKSEKARVLQNFNYADLDSDTQLVVKQCTNEIRTLIRRSAQDVIKIGRKLIQVKEQIGHGHFRNWLKIEFDWSVRTAARFMQVATKFKCADLAHLNIAASALYLLSETSTPSEAQAEILDLARQGERINYAKAKDIINEYKEAGKSIALEPPSEYHSKMTTSKSLTFDTVSPEKQTVVTQRAVVAEKQGDKLLEETRETSAQMCTSELLDDAIFDNDCIVDSAEEESGVESQLPSLIGSPIYFVNDRQQRTQLFGEIVAVEEEYNSIVVVRISVRNLEK
jgi:hypothetical protein